MIQGREADCILVSSPTKPQEALGLTEEQTRELRARLSSFEEDWNAPGMEAYDDI